MRLNTIKPQAGSKKAPRRVGRGPGSGVGKTCALGHKGQKARAGGYHKVGFEGGQMPLQRRLPKVGFRSAKARQFQEIPTRALSAFQDTPVTLLSLKEKGLITSNIKFVKIVLNGEVTHAVRVEGIPATKGALAAITAQGGTVA